jgi:hypothetical protein
VPALLAATRDADASVRAEAESALAGLPAGLADTARGHSDPETRAAAVARIRDDATLEALVRIAPPDTARQAFDQLRDPLFLVSLARSGPPAFRPLALDRLTDPAPLAPLARDANPELRAGATARLLALARTAAPADRPKVLAALGEGGSLLELAGNASPEVALALAGFTEDAEVLAVLAAHPDAAVARAAAGRSGDPRVAAAAAGHSDEGVRLDAFRRIEDQERIAAAARSDPSPRVRLALASRLHGTGTLTRLAKADASPAVRRVAAVLLRQPARGKKPVVGLQLRKEDKFLDLVRSKLPGLLEDRAIVVECGPDECPLFAARAAVEVAVSDSDQCFQKYYYTGPCGNPGKDVSFRFAFFRDGESVGTETFAGRTPTSVQYTVTTYGGVAIGDMGPAAADVWRSTDKAVRASAGAWKLTPARVDLERLLSW